MNKYFELSVLRRCALIFLSYTGLGWIFYGLFGHLVIEAAYKSDSLGIADKLMAGRAFTPLGDYFQAADRMVLANTFWTVGLILLFLLIMNRPFWLLYACGSVLLFTFMAFGLFEVVPSIADAVHLDVVDYYRYKKYYTVDDKLGFKEKAFLHIAIRKTFSSFRYGVEIPPMTAVSGAF